MQVLNDILNNNGFHKADGNWHSLTSAINKTEADFIAKLLLENKPKSTLEIGCAEGVSSMVICSSIEPNVTHTILDPNQSGHWENMGINNLKRCGLHNFKLMEEYSEFALPKLLQEGKQFDFVFVDGWHTFDHVLLEFFYINRLLTVGGIVVFDDVALPPLNRLMRYITNYPNFEIIGAAGEFYESKNRKTLDKIKNGIQVLSKVLGSKLQAEILNDTVVRSSQSLGINGSIAAFRKTAQDNRGWAWYEYF